MKYINLRNNIYYYRRRIPSTFDSICNINRIYRPLSANRKLSIKLAKRYNDLFEIIEVGLRLNHNVDIYVQELDIQKTQQVDVYQLYISSLNVSSNRIAKINRLLTVIKALLPKCIDKLSMAQLDSIKHTIMELARRNIQHRE